MSAPFLPQTLGYLHLRPNPETVAKQFKFGSKRFASVGLGGPCYPGFCRAQLCRKCGVECKRPSSECLSPHRGYALWSAGASSAQLELRLVSGGSRDESRLLGVLQGHLATAGLRAKLEARNAERTRFRVRLSARGVPLCLDGPSAGWVQASRPYLLGVLPKVSLPTEREFQGWPDEAQAEERSKRWIQAARPSQQRGFWQKLHRERCWYPLGERLAPVWGFWFGQATVLYRVYADGERVYHLEDLFFDLQSEGWTQAYATNPIAGDLETFPMKFSGDGTLANTHFRTLVDSYPRDGVEAQRAKASDHHFIYPPEDPRFVEVSAFTHAHLAQRFRQQGYQPGSSDLPTVLRVDRFPSFYANNAMYLPPEATSHGAAEITLGNGDGQILQNLALDNDVMTHEFAHHVVLEL